jgi:DNA-binding CsgD family transcriptional regulator
MRKPSTGRILTKRQEEIVALVAEGFSNKEVAENLNIGAGTVKVHLHKIFEALGIKSRRHLFNFSGGTAREARVGLLEPHFGRHATTASMPNTTIRSRTTQ